jgi:hypothetical protein
MMGRSSFDLSAFPEPTVPHFYKYGTDLHWLEALIAKSELFIPTAEELKEPPDSHPPIRTLSESEALEYLAKVLPPPANARDRLEAFIAEFGASMITQLITEMALFKYKPTRILSMSRRWNNARLWAGPGGSRKGYCVEFLNSGFFRLGREVLYTSESIGVEPAPSVQWILRKTLKYDDEEEVRICLPDGIFPQPMRINADQVSLIILGQDVDAKSARSIDRWASSRKPTLKVVRVKSCREGENGLVAMPSGRPYRRVKSQVGTIRPADIGLPLIPMTGVTVLSQPPPRATPATDSHFYKYGRHVERLRDVLIKHELYIPRADQLNDPRESQPPLRRLAPDEVVDFLARTLLNREPGAPPVEQQITGLKRAVSELGADVMMTGVSGMLFSTHAAARIYSVSKRWDNMALWAAYGDNHKGFCLEFVNDGLFKMCNNVVYVDEISCDLADPSWRDIDWNMYKKTEWRYEEEVRLCLPGDMLAQPIKIAPTQLSRLILGKDISRTDRERLRKWATQRQPPLVVMQTQYDSYLQKLTLSSI